MWAWHGKKSGTWWHWRPQDYKQLTSDHLLIIKAKQAWEPDNTDFRVSKNKYQLYVRCSIYSTFMYKVELQSNEEKTNCKMRQDIKIASKGPYKEKQEIILLPPKRRKKPLPSISYLFLWRTWDADNLLSDCSCPQSLANNIRTEKDSGRISYNSGEWLGTRHCLYSSFNSITINIFFSNSIFFSFVCND